MAVSFDQPLLLLVLPPSLAVVYWFWRTSRVYLPPVRRYLALALRSLAVALLVAGLSGPSIRLNASDLSIAILLDRSASITPAERAQEEAFVQDTLSHKAQNDRVAVISFAGEATVERPLSTDPSPPNYAEDDTLRPSRTDLAKAIQLGLGVLPPDSARRLVLISDGNANAGDAQQAAQLAKTAGVQLETLALTADSGPQALVDSLDAPSRVHQGDSFSVTVQVRATQPMDATLELLADDRLVGSQDVQLQAGANRFIMPIDTLQQGTHVLQVVMQTDADARPENKTGGAYVVVDGPPSVLIVEGTPGEGQYLAQALQAAGLQVDVTQPQAGPFQPDTLNNYAAVVMANVPANLLSNDGMTALKNYVQSHGGGLVVSGGDQSFGPGLYARTPLEDVLPVQADLRGSSLQAGVGLVLAIDTSGSMSQDVGGTTIMDLAKEAALGAMETLGAGDDIGVISFEDKSSWAIPPTPADQTDAITGAVNQMTPGGGDDTLAGALQLGYDGLQPVQARVKHEVVITDGETPSGDYASIVQQMQANGISVSTIGIGEQADTQQLQQLAQAGGGAYYDGSDPFDLPQLVLKETQQLQRAAIVEKPTQAVAVGDSPALSGIDPQTLPQLRGYVATTPKPQSSVVLASPSADPLLVEWQYGLGRVEVWTSDATNRWSTDWLNQGQSFEQFWAQVVKRSMRQADDPNRQVAVSLSGDQATISLDAQTDQHQYVNFLPTVASVVDPLGTPVQVQLPQIGPGQYQATLPATAEGVYTLQVTETSPDGGTTSQSSGFVVPYSPEYRDLGTNTELLDSLSSVTGGHGLQTGADAVVHDLPSVGAPRTIWPWLLALLAIVLVCDIGVRRLRLSAFELRASYRALQERMFKEVEPPTRTRKTGWVPTAVPLVATTRDVAAPRAAPTPTAPLRSQQLLAAKRRATKR
ncbi:MAG: VWA domain-containing protein [Chloroflexi bacterium]|nr:VWA domain-containing protein [Chloroflexota bacterium]